MIDKANELKMSQSGQKTEGHHSFPKFLGGPDIQRLVPLSHDRHVNLHKDLRGFLQDNYPEMEPKPSNSGLVIRRNFSSEETAQAMGRFYLSHLDTYADAALQFFTDHPETLTDGNLKWAIENAVSIRAKDYIFNWFREETPE